MIYTREQCEQKLCLVECLSCGFTIHLDDDEDFAICEECASTEPFIGYLQSNNWLEKFERHFARKPRTPKGGG